MFRFLLRLFGFLFLVALVAAAAFALYLAVRDPGLLWDAAGVTWNRLHSTSLQQLQAGIQRNIWPPLWDNVIIPVLLWPTWLALGAWICVTGLFGLMLMAGTRRRR